MGGFYIGLHSHQLQKFRVIIMLIMYLRVTASDIFESCIKLLIVPELIESKKTRLQGGGRNNAK